MVQYTSEEPDALDRGPFQSMVEETMEQLSGHKNNDPNNEEDSVFDVTGRQVNTPPEVHEGAVDEDTGTPSG